MSKPVYKPDPQKTFETNLIDALFTIAGELHNLNIGLSSLGFAEKTLSDGTVYSEGAIQGGAELIAKKLGEISDHLADR